LKGRLGHEEKETAEAGEEISPEETTGEEARSGGSPIVPPIKWGNGSEDNFLGKQCWDRGLQGKKTKATEEVSNT